MLKVLRRLRYRYWIAIDTPDGEAGTVSIIRALPSLRRAPKTPSVLMRNGSVYGPYTREQAHTEHDMVVGKHATP